MRKVGLILFTIVLYCVIGGCGSDTKDAELMKFDKEYSLQHKAYDTELMIQSAYMQTMDSLLLLSSYNSDTVCSLYSIPQGMKQVCRYGVLGNGPREFLQPVLTYSYQNTFGINEINKQELAILEVNADPKGNLFITEQKRLKAPYKRKKGELVLPDAFITRLDDSHYISRICGGENNFFSLDVTAFHAVRSKVRSCGHNRLLHGWTFLSKRIAYYAGCCHFAGFVQNDP